MSVIPPVNAESVFGLASAAMGLRTRQGRGCAHSHPRTITRGRMGTQRDMNADRRSLAFLCRTDFVVIGWIVAQVQSRLGLQSILTGYET